MTQTLIQSIRMLAAGMATAFLSRKPRATFGLYEAEPRYQPATLPDSPDDMLFESGRASWCGLTEQVKRHNHAMNGLGDLLASLREVVSGVADKAPIVIDSPLPVAAGAEVWGAFDDALFDVVPRPSGSKPVAIFGAAEDILFDDDRPVEVPTLALLASRVEASHGVRF